MISFFKKSFFWLLRRLISGCVLAAIGLALCAWWRHAHDPLDFAQRRALLLESYATAQSANAATRAELEKHAASLEAQLLEQEAKVAAASRAIEAHRALESSWKRILGDAEQQNINDRQREEQEKIRDGATAKITALKQEQTDSVLRRQIAAIDATRIESRIQKTNTENSKVLHHARAAWDDGRWWASAFVAFWIVWPALRKAFLYFAVAPFVVRRKPLRLARRADVAPALRDAGDTVTVELWPGERLCVKPLYLDSADSELTWGGRFWLKGRFPFMNLACGLVRLKELRNARAGTAQRAFLDASARRMRELGKRRRRAELTVVDLPENGSLVLRPRFLAGVVQRIDEPLVIRSHWRFFRWHSWVTGQFRFFEFAGPCRLIIASQRGVQAESLEPREDRLRPVRRANEWATIGFTPALRYRPARAESFWSYCRGLSPLYDDLFIGTGLFFVQKTAPGQGRFDRGFFKPLVAACWRGFQKVFGM